MTARHRAPWWRSALAAIRPRWDRDPWGHHARPQPGPAPLSCEPLYPVKDDPRWPHLDRPWDDGTGSFPAVAEGWT